MSKLLAIVVVFIVLFSGGTSFAEADTNKSLPVDVVGVTVTPHVRAQSLRYRRKPDPELGALVRLFIRNTSPIESGKDGVVYSHAVTFDDQEPQRLILQENWAWHDTPSIWTEEELEIPAGAMVVWSFNSKKSSWGVGKEFKLRIADWQRARAIELPICLAAPKLWLSAVTFLSSDSNVAPDTLVFHVANRSESPVKILGGRLYLPMTNTNWRLLFPQPDFSRIEMFPANGTIPAGDKGCARIKTGRLPLSYAALQIDLADKNENRQSLWAHVRIKSERFDVSGGWVDDSDLPISALTREPFLKTLKRMHINTAHIVSVPDYTDQTGPEGLYTRYPLKLFGRLDPIEDYDTDAMLPRIHGIEFLGEPQYSFDGMPLSPQAVWIALSPYAPSRLPITVTLSDESLWRYYAGLSDYPHFDAYRICAPSADSWRLYDRWGEQQIGWGAPLETIGDLCRCLRELSRPAPIAYWSQGPHYGWQMLDGRKRVSPTPDELRLQAYHALSSRITSLYWFNLSLRALVEFKDTIDPITRVGREIRMLEDLYLEGDAYSFRQLRYEGAPDWELASIASPRGALLFALDLDYAPNRSKEFEFKRPRPARFLFDLPSWLQQPADVFRVDADGVYDVEHKTVLTGLEIFEKQGKVAIYVASPTRELRGMIEAKRKSLVAYEQSIGFDPAGNRKDFDALKSILEETVP